MNDDARPDYTTMSGAEFKRAVGADPEKWAEAFILCGHMPAFIHADMVSWFRDAMEAAVKAEHDGRLQALLAMPVIHREIDPLTSMENTALQDCLAGLRLALAAQQRGDDQTMLEILRLKVKQLGIITSD